MIISAPAAFSSDTFALSGIIGADALIIPKKAPLVKVETVFEQRIIASYLYESSSPCAGFLLRTLRIAFSAGFWYDTDKFTGEARCFSRQEARNMKLLILGGSGFVSGRLAQIATAQGHEVWCVTRGNRPIPEGVHALMCDAHDPAALRAALASAQLQWDAALDCICRDAASASVDLSVLPAFTNRLLVISTDSVYHPAYKRVPQDETGVYLHDGGYGSSKRQMEEVFLDAAAHSESPFAWTIFRPGHIFGAGSQVGCFPEHSRQPDLIARMNRGEPLRLVGGGKFLIHPIYVDDLCRVLLESIPVSTAFNEIFCIGGPDIVSNAAYYLLLGEILNVPVTIEEIPLAGYLEAHPLFSGHLCHRAYSLEKLRRTGIALPGTPLRAGLQKQVEWLLSLAR
jgi:NAD dependent epimerase/dehydratase family protein